MILAGITIASLTESGLFENARKAEQEYKNAQERENKILLDYENKLKNPEIGENNVTKFDIVKQLGQGITIDNSINKIEENASYNAKITVNNEYVLDTLSVTMGTQEVEINLETKQINIPKVTDDIRIVATSKKITIETTETVTGTPVLNNSDYKTAPSSYQFNGNNYFSIDSTNYIFGTSTFSISFWMKSSSTPNWSRINRTISN